MSCRTSKKKLSIYSSGRWTKNVCRWVKCIAADLIPVAATTSTSSPSSTSCWASSPTARASSCSAPSPGSSTPPGWRSQLQTNLREDFTINHVLNVKCTFNQEKAQVGAFSVIVQPHQLIGHQSAVSATKKKQFATCSEKLLELVWQWTLSLTRRG